MTAWRERGQSAVIEFSHSFVPPDNRARIYTSSLHAMKCTDHVH